ncbi:WD repeat-containing protein 31 [Strongylocentrotus purpuratus]|uniref:WD repeat domain 31 n=1 Tax=Strongylocentrotus purpuratus TaxID=7668 RepID=A0A7M7HIF0_STRPU|nr:WD repeat-containing protein 31 [Strongylocentrotus purpuratus]XP_011670346.2 WD repeat-containing protein 31 [Strongylocentrotus purpuratus]XP_011670347.2 WD repeat-containing protein 31 [Strongylocentrotus purpuratus]
MGLRQSKSKTNSTKSAKYMSSIPEPASDEVKRYDPVHTDAVLSVSCLGNNGFLSAGADQTIVSYQWQEGKVLQKWTGHCRDVTKVAYSQALDRVFSGSRDKTAKMWTREGAAGTTVNEAILTFVGHNLVVNGLASVDVSRRLCTGGRDNSVRLWDTETGGCIKEVTTSRNLVTHMVTIPRTEMVIQSSEDKSIRIWDTRTLEESSVSNKKSYIQTCCDVRSDGTYCLSCSNGFSGQGCEASIWDLRSLRDPLREFKGHSQTASGCCFLHAQSNSSPMFLTCSHDQTVKLWDQSSGDCLCTVSLSGSKQLTSITANTDGSICVGSFETGVQILSIGQDCNGLWDMKPVAQY